MRFSVRRSLGGMAAAALAALAAAGPAWAATAITSPANGARGNDTSPAFTGTAGVGGSTSPTVTVKIWTGTAVPADAADPVRQLTATRNETTGAWTVAVNGPPPAGPALPGGTYTARAEQANGAVTDSSPPVTFTVDTAAPALSVVTPAPGQRFGMASPSMGGAAGNAAGDSSAVAVKVLTADASTVVRSLTVTRSGASWSTALAPLTGGSYILQATQSDDVGNATTVSRPFTIDVSAPALFLATPADGSSTTDTTPGFSGTAGNSTGDAGEVVVRIYPGAAVAGAPIQTITVARSGTSWSGAVGELAPGQYTAEARQSDDVGNQAVAQSTFTVASALSVTSPAVTPPGTDPPPVARPIFLSPFPIVRIVGALTKKGARLSLFTVRAPARSTVQIRCKGTSCPFRTQSSKAGVKDRTVKIKHLVGRALRAGVVIEVRVTGSSRWGKFTRFRIRQAKAPLRSDSCLRPGRSTPVKCPA
jgi:hypothetical protein